ncbi:MAG: hypothetical protein JW892_13330 [Anaerolineae bacterium]|nr:hypothetical protein [Anaerolineae bacterium]
MKVSWGARSGVRLLVLALLLGALLFVVFLHDWIADVLVVRGAYYVWLLGLLLRSRPQMLYWMLPVICGVGMGMLVLIGSLRPRARISPPPVVLGRAAEWHEWLACASNQPFFRKYLRRKLENLTRETLQLEQPLPSAYGRAVASASSTPLPPELQGLFAAHLPYSIMDEEDPVGPWNPEVVVEYLESTLEGKNDH